jgi:hypothetical protein
MNEYIKNHIQIAFGLALLAGALVVGAFVAHYNVKQLAGEVGLLLAQHETTMYELSIITDRNGADEKIEKIIVDCPRRSEYEAYLNNLARLPKKDLLLVQGLFESCGLFYTERKALMVSKLEREYEGYVELIKLLETLGEESPKNKDIWKQIVDLENTRSTLLSDQSSIQEKIISLLLSGATPNSKNVTDLTREAQEISELLSVQDRQIDTLRDSIQK